MRSGPTIGQRGALGQRDAICGRPGVALFLAASLAALAASFAFATGARADELAEGARLYHEGEFEQAITRLERAETALPGGAPRARARLFRGLAHAVLAQWDAARASFSAALADDADVDLDREATKPSVVALFDDVRKRLVGTLVCTTDRAATVFVGGTALGPAPLTKRLLRGTYVVRAASPDGFAEVVQEGAVVRGGETTTLALKLSRKSGRVSVRSEPAGAAVFAEGRRIATTPVTGLVLPAGRHALVLQLEGHQRAPLEVLVHPAVPAELTVKLVRIDTRPWYRKKRVWGYIGAGVGAALLAGGAIAGVLARSAESEIASRGHEGTLDYDRLRSLSDSATTRARAANALFVAGGAAAVTSLILFLVNDGPRDAADAKAGPARWPEGWRFAVGPLGVVWQKRF